MTRVIATLMVAFLGACGAAVEGETSAVPQGRSQATLRVATFNVSLFREEPGTLAADIRAWTDPQLEAVASVIGDVVPDVLVLNEFDYEEDGAALAAFAERLGYPYRLGLPSNTGVASGRDFDKDGQSDHAPGSREYGGDAFGYGTHAGQYGIAVISKLPLEEARVRTYREMLWDDMPGNVLPADYYDAGDRSVFRLSSKTHAIVPVRTPSGPLNLVLAHPTPPGFDGPENRNGRRNRDEIRLLHDIVDPARGDYLVDDAGAGGGLEAGAMFVVAGDLNADPVDGDEHDAITRLLDSPLVTDPAPRSAGGPAAAERQGKGNARQSGDPAFDTADFSDRTVGNLRVDYVLPSATIDVVRSGVYWPAEGEAGYEFVGPGYPAVSSDHRLVWVDLRLPGAEIGG